MISAMIGSAAVFRKARALSGGEKKQRNIFFGFFKKNVTILIFCGKMVFVIIFLSKGDVSN